MVLVLFFVVIVIVAAAAVALITRPRIDCVTLSFRL